MTRNFLLVLLTTLVETTFRDHSRSPTTPLWGRTRVIYHRWSFRYFNEFHLWCENGVSPRVFIIILIRLHLITSKMRPIVTDGVALSVGQSVGLWRSCALQNRWTDRDAVWYVDSGGPKEACIRWVHIGATWRIRLNRPCAAAMRPYVKLLGPLVINVACRWRVQSVWCNTQAYDGRTRLTASVIAIY